MSLVDFKKRLCRPVKFKGRGPHSKNLVLGQYRFIICDIFLNSICLDYEVLIIIYL